MFKLHKRKSITEKSLQRKKLKNLCYKVKYNSNIIKKREEKH